MRRPTPESVNLINLRPITEVVQEKLMFCEIISLTVEAVQIILQYIQETRFSVGTSQKSWKWILERLRIFDVFVGWPVFEFNFIVRYKK